MARMKIDGVPPLDGTYQLDLEFTHRDYSDIKRIAGIRANEAMEALEAGDVDMLVALASISLRRAGVRHDPDLLFDSKVGTLELMMDEDEVEVVEDPTMSANGTQTSTSEGASGNDTKDATGISPEISTPDFSGIPQPDSSSGQVISRT